MIKSMTGFGRAQAAVEDMEISAEIKAVNHRYFEFSCKLPRQYSFLEDKIKNFVSGFVNRGKVDVFISIQKTNDTAVEVTVNRALAESYAAALKELRELCGLTSNISVNDIAKYPDVLTVTKAEEDEDAIWNTLKPVLSSAVDAFIKMRLTEGQRMKADILEKCDHLMKMVSVVEENSKATAVAYRERLEAKMRELLDDKQIDESRLLTETAIFADKIAVDEETVRLRSHADQLHSMMASDAAVGRKLDFLLQEMNRETNTIGSKCSNVEITKIVVDMKSELEKIREQIQNIE